MDRRNALLTLSGILATSAFIATPARQTFAQTNRTTPLGPVQYKARTLSVGSFAKQSSELALSKATHPKIKQFAQFEVAEQTTIAQVLTNENNPPPAPLDSQHAALMHQLQEQSAKAFDVAYLQDQIAGHRELLNIQQDFLSGTPPDRDQEHIAMMARTVIQMHLVMLTDLQNELPA